MEAQPHQRQGQGQSVVGCATSTNERSFSAQHQPHAHHDAQQERESPQAPRAHFHFSGQQEGEAQPRRVASHSEGSLVERCRHGDNRLKALHDLEQITALPPSPGPTKEPFRGSID